MDNFRLQKEEFIKRGKKWKKITFYFTGGEYEKKIGELYIRKGERVYFKKVNSVLHKMRILDGYGIQSEVFDEYLRGKKGRIVIDEEDTGARLTSDIKTWQEKGVYRNYGEQKQIFVSVKFMNCIKPII